jgi:hypothetical protein
MTDIVERLRTEVPCISDIGCAYELCGEAADEIERLRAALIDSREELDDYYLREYRSDDPIIQKRLEEVMASNPARVALRGKS